MLDGLQDGVYVVDTDRRITFWNKSAERLSGYTADESIPDPVTPDT
jgi:PAS domain S-box-containing protein